MISFVTWGLISLGLCFCSWKTAALLMRPLRPARPLRVSIIVLCSSPIHVLLRDGNRGATGLGSLIMTTSWLAGGRARAGPRASEVPRHVYTVARNMNGHRGIFKVTFWLSLVAVGFISPQATVSVSETHRGTVPAHVVGKHSHPLPEETLAETFWWFRHHTCNVSR